MSNIILNLLDEKFILKFFKERVLPLYPSFSGIKKVSIIPHKKLIWEHSYHVVLEFQIIFIHPVRKRPLTKSGINNLSCDQWFKATDKRYFSDRVEQKNKTKSISIFATAHSSEPRKNVYSALKFLWNHNFSKGYLTIPHPLFYSNFYKATFYRGVNGNNLYYYIRNKNFAEIEKIIPKVAAWFAKLHKIPALKAKNFNKKNSRIKTVFPGVEHILEKINEKYPEHYEISKKIYNIIIKSEEKFLSSTSRRWLVHGDAHPENVIKMGAKKIAIIDFTDLCLSDFARDLGAFTQQLDYMCFKKIGDSAYSKKIKNLFLKNYLFDAKIKLNEDLKKRIDIYYNWTAMRTATFLLLRHEPHPEHAKILLEQICKNFNINIKTQM